MISIIQEDQCRFFLAPAIEDLRKLHVKLKQLKDQLSSNQLIDPQKIKEDVCTIYRQCCAISRKVQLEQTGFKNEIEQLRTENRKLTEERMSAETGGCIMTYKYNMYMCMIFLFMFHVRMQVILQLLNVNAKMIIPSKVCSICLNFKIVS